MITQLKFHNFRILKDATLPLGRVTVIIGPNGSGKSTALLGLKALADGNSRLPAMFLSVQLEQRDSVVEITVVSVDPGGTIVVNTKEPDRRPIIVSTPEYAIRQELLRARVYAFDPNEIARPCMLEKTFEVGANGANLASVLTSLQDQFPERFETLNADLHRWMPDFDRILLDTVHGSKRAFVLRTSVGKHPLPADQLSHGNLIAIALLTLSHLPNPPSIIGLEEIDRGIHPRLFRELLDSVNRLAFPENFGDARKPVQVIMTTHSPYLLDLFRDHPEDIVIAEKNGLSASFHRLVDLPHMDDILRDTHLGEAWYSGVLGGVPVGS